MTTASDAIAAFDSLPIATLDTILAGSKPLILSPHPDDESLGCGGLIAESCAQGTPPLVVILTDGAGSHPGSVAYKPRRLAEIRQAESRAAASRLGLPPQNLVFLEQPDSALAATPALIDQLVALMQTHGCTALIAPWRCDPHRDHQQAAAIAQQLAAAISVRLISYPVWGWLLPPDSDIPIDRIAGWRLDIASHQPAKQAAIAAHASQHGELITDSPQGFRLPQALLAIFARPFEVFLTE